jgi:dethiobiotin synthetase
VRGLFVTGTDTDCGKTRVAVAVIRRLRADGLRVAGFKPVAAGAEPGPDGALRNADALALAAASGLDLAYELVNPYCFAPPIAPHIAATEAGVTIEAGRLRAVFDGLARSCDLVVTEGAGGWRVPLGPGFDIQSLALDLRLPVVLVVGLRLGCLNHAQLTEQSILASGARLLGWIGSAVDPHMARRDDNLAALGTLLASPCLGVLGHAGGPAEELAALDRLGRCLREGVAGEPASNGKK